VTFARLPLSALRALEAVVRKGKVVQAAAELSVTPGAVTRQIRALEDLVGAPLFARTTDGLKPTERGLALAATVTGSLRQLSDGLSLSAGSAVVLRVGAPRNFAALALAPRIGRFLDRHPAVDLHVDGSLHGENPAAGAVDVVIRYGIPETPAGHRATLLAPHTIFPVASPALAAALRAAGGDLLAGARHLHFRSVDYWARWSDATGQARPPRAGPTLSETIMLYEAAAAGQGVAIGHSILAGTFLAEGRLVAVGPAAPDAHRYAVLTATSAAKPEALAFADWLAAEIGAD
jgi:DNA-binding transcriptional LysR family regulator